MDIVEKRIKALVKIQSIDCKLDEIRVLRGDLPDEVQDLEDEIAGLQTRLNKFDEELASIEQSIDDRKNGIKEAEKLIEKYKDQQMKVRNNREYDAITKEIELQELEIQICEKKIKEGYATIEQKKQVIDDTKSKLTGGQENLDLKKGELDVILNESKEDEEKLLVDRGKAEAKIEERLRLSYNKLRTKCRNGLAVVNVKRDACGGCFSIVPPQRQADVRDKKKLMVCEHCGRILADVEDVIIEEVPKKRTTRAKKKASA